MPRKGENIYKRKDGRWEARYVRGRKGGKTLYGYAYGKSYAEVKAKKAVAASSFGSMKFDPTKKAIAFDELAAIWLSYVRHSVKESTYTRYFRTIRKYLVPATGNKPVEKFDRETLAGLSDRLTLEGGIEKDRLSPKTVTDILCVFKSVLKFGGENGYAVPDTAVIKYPKKTCSKVNVPTDAGREKIIRALISSEDPTALGIIFALFTGVRIGELCGLRWGDIDFGESFVTVSRIVERISDLNPLSSSKTKVIVTEPKTENSVRIIPLPGFLLEYLRERRRSDSCYLVTGSPFCSEPHGVYVKYKRCLKEHGIEDYTFHALRHSFATCCVEAGFDLKSLSEILGHSNVSTTLSLYVHPTLRRKKEQMEMLTPQFFTPSENPSDKSEETREDMTFRLPR